MIRTLSFSFLLFVLLILSDCTNVDVNYYENKKQYNEILNLYPKELVDHLPNYSYGNIMFLNLMFPRGKYLSYIHIVKYLSKKDSQAFQDSVQRKSICSLPFKDYILHATENSIPLAFQNTLQFVKVDKFSIKQLPIPGFEFYPNTGLPHDYNSNAIIYVLGCESGKFLKDDYLIEDKGENSSVWLHGYSKGVVLYQRYAIFWLEVW